MTHASGAHRNRLAHERSPYLLQHASNPVDWWPWGEEAIAEARRLDRPLFVSIGYATCHWCHVMARESFENEAIGALLRDRFVCVKVDREERPEVDEVCMTACQIFTQLVEGRPSGGWPLSIWLDPKSLRPFFVDTYFPPEPAHGRPSFAQVCEALSSAWRTQRAEIEEQSTRLGALVERQLGADDSAAPLARERILEIARDAATRLMSMEDRAHGGFGGAPKFPQPCFLELLLEVGRRGEPEMLEAVRRQLVAMAAGGIHDQVGGGFHRYAVDATWTVPHFEKMLYDNGQLASLYARADAVFGEPRFLEVSERLCAFVQRELSSAEGGFLCALDAEANGHEGEGYVWTRAAFDRALRDAGLPDDVEWAAAALGLSEGPNFADPHDPDPTPSNVLVDRITWGRGGTDASARAGANADDLDRLARVRTALLTARAGMPRPSTDDKVVPAWNGLMIEGMAATAAALRERHAASSKQLLAAAASAADFVLSHMRTADGGLIRTWRGTPSSVPASLEDLGSMACALFALAESARSADGMARWFEPARRLLDFAETHFADGRGGWFDAPAGGLLPVRARSLNDGAMPSGTTLMIDALARLAALDAGAAPAALSRINAAVAASSAHLTSNPLGATRLLAALVRGFAPAA